MKWRLTGILMCVLALVGCNDEVQKPETTKRVVVNTVMGPVEVTSLKQDVNLRAFSVRVAGTQVDATLEIVPSGDGVTTFGGTATLSDASGAPLYSLEMTLDRSTGDVIYRESTGDDYLSFSVREENDRIYETYDANGDIASFAYPVLNEETRMRVGNLVKHNLPTGHLPADAREYAAQAASFRDYIAPHAGSPVNNSPEGQLMVQVLSSPEVPNILVGGPNLQIKKGIKAFCHSMTVCTVVTCTFLPGNPVCLFCSGGVIACEVFFVIADLVGWDD